MEYSARKPEIGGGLARNCCHKAVFQFFDHTGLHVLQPVVEQEKWRPEKGVLILGML